MSANTKAKKAKIPVLLLSALILTGGDVSENIGNTDDDATTDDTEFINGAGGTVSEFPYESVVSIASDVALYWSDEHGEEYHESVRQEQTDLYNYYGHIHANITTKVMFADDDIADSFCHQGLFRESGADAEFESVAAECIVSSENVEVVQAAGEGNDFSDLTLLREFSGGHRVSMSYANQLLYENWPNYPSVDDPSRLVFTFWPLTADWGQNVIANPDMMHPQLEQMLSDGDIEYSLSITVEDGYFYDVDDSGLTTDTVSIINETLLSGGGGVVSGNNGIAEVRNDGALTLRVQKDDVRAAEVIDTGQVRQNVIGFGLLTVFGLLVLAMPTLLIVLIVMLWKRGRKLKPESEDGSVSS